MIKWSDIDLSIPLDRHDRHASRWAQARPCFTSEWTGHPKNSLYLCSRQTNTSSQVLLQRSPNFEFWTFLVSWIVRETSSKNEQFLKILNGQFHKVASLVVQCLKNLPYYCQVTNLRRYEGCFAELKALWRQVPENI